MGLREKQWVREYKEEKMPQFQDKLKELTGGGQIEVEVDWDTFITSEKALEYFHHQGLDYIYNAISRICYNDFGKAAIREGLKRIVVKNFGDNKQVKVSFADNTLYVNGAWAADSGGYPSETDIQRVIEDGL